MYSFINITESCTLNNLSIAAGNCLMSSRTDEKQPYTHVTVRGPIRHSCQFSDSKCYNNFPLHSKSRHH